MPKRQTAQILHFELPLRINPPAPLEPGHRPDVRMFPSGRRLLTGRERGGWTEQRILEAARTATLLPASEEASNLSLSNAVREGRLAAYNPDTGEALFANRYADGLGWLFSGRASDFSLIEGMPARSWYYRAPKRPMKWEKVFGDLCTPTPWERRAFAL